MFVLDGHTADLILVAARTDAGVSLFAVDGDAAGPHPHAAVHHGPDPQAGQARVRRHAGHADRHRGRGLGRRSTGCSTWPPSAWPPSRSAAPRRCLEMAVEYAKVRVQFGRPIGSFQAIKHKCADMLLEVESARSAAYYAAWCAAEMNDELPVGGLAGQGLLLRGVLPRGRREHPDPRRHRLHLGAPGPPVLQAGQELRAAVRRPHLPPRAARPAHRHLSRTRQPVAIGGSTGTLTRGTRAVGGRPLLPRAPPSGPYCLGLSWGQAGALRHGRESHREAGAGPPPARGQAGRAPGAPGPPRSTAPARRCRDAAATRAPTAGGDGVEQRGVDLRVVGGGPRHPVHISLHRGFGAPSARVPGCGPSRSGGNAGPRPWRWVQAPADARTSSGWARAVRGPPGSRPARPGGRPGSGPAPRPSARPWPCPGRRAGLKVRRASPTARKPSRETLHALVVAPGGSPCAGRWRRGRGARPGPPRTRCRGSAGCGRRRRSPPGSAGGVFTSPPAADTVSSQRLPSSGNGDARHAARAGGRAWISARLPAGRVARAAPVAAGWRRRGRSR